MRKYSKEVIEFIRNNAVGKGSKEITELVNNNFGTNFTVENIKSLKARYKILSGLTGHFEKGHSPHNKGKCLDDYMSKEAQSKIKQTCFTKGKNVNNQRHNWKSIGTEYIDKDGYVKVRVEDKVGEKSHAYWELKQRLIWQEHYGEIPKDSVIIFADGNKRNFDIDNLLCVSRYELLTMNQNDLIKKYGEATKSGLLIAKLYIKMNELKKCKGE